MGYLVNVNNDEYMLFFLNLMVQLDKYYFFTIIKLIFLNTRWVQRIAHYFALMMIMIIKIIKKCKYIKCLDRNHCP